MGVAGCEGDTSDPGTGPVTPGWPPGSDMSGMPGSGSGCGAWRPGGAGEAGCSDVGAGTVGCTGACEGVGSVVGG